MTAYRSGKNAYIGLICHENCIIWHANLGGIVKVCEHGLLQYHIWPGRESMMHVS